jgi:hypothetical protein
MKKILFILSLLCVNGAFAQTDTLYLIFDPQTPKVMKDIRKYLHMSGDLSPKMSECGVSVLESGEYYRSSYPLDAGRPLRLKRKVGTTVQEIPLSQVSVLYPKAMTVPQLDVYLQPKMEHDYAHPQRHRYDYQMAKFFMRSNLAVFKVIELKPAEGKALVVDVVINPS